MMGEGRGTRTRAAGFTLVTAVAAMALAVGTLGCGADAPPGGDVSAGPVEKVVDEVAATVWPGNFRSDGVRHVRMINGFVDGEPTAYWFIGFASRTTADVFLMCREGDTACPFDAKGKLDRSRLVGDPVFARMPGEVGYSPFWLAWVVRVKDAYKANEFKSVFSIEQAARDGTVTVEQAIFDHGGDHGPDDVVMHCLLVLDGTSLERNGDELTGKPGKMSRKVELQNGWHKRYRVQFFEFTGNEGVFSSDSLSESRERMRISDIFVMFRDCEGGSKSLPCQIVHDPIAAISERGMETDITKDGDKRDTNNVLVAFPGQDPKNPEDLPYSPLWRVNVVKIKAAHDKDLTLVDTTGKQDVTDIKSIADIRERVAKGWLYEPEFMPEAMAGDRIPGNDGNVFFNCPSQVADE